MTVHYPIICFFCLIIQGIVLIKKLVTSSRNTEDMLFIRVLISMMFFSALDGLYGLETVGFLPQVRSLAYLLNTLYYCFSAIMVFMWTRYAQYVMKSKFFSTNRTFYFIGYIPLIFILIISITAYWDGLLFYIDEAAIYHRGPLFPFQQVVSYYYLIIESIVALYKANRPENYPERMIYYTIASFPLFPTLSLPLYMLMPNCPGSTMGLTIGCVQAIVFGLTTEISSDNLTGIYNKSSLYKYIRPKIGDSKSLNNTYLLIVDLDDFHNINEKNGHAVGDDALKLTSKAIVKACESYHAFVSRFGGDDFAIVVETRNQIYIDRLIEDLYKELAQVNENSGLPFVLSFSIGYSVLNDKHTSIQSFINDAERRLFEAKTNRE